MSIAFTKSVPASPDSPATPSVVGFSAPIATWISIITSLVLAASFYFSHVQKASDDAAVLGAQQSAVQLKLSEHDKALFSMASELAKIDGKIDVLLGQQQAKQKAK